MGCRGNAGLGVGAAMGAWVDTAAGPGVLSTGASDVVGIGSEAGEVD